MTMTTEQQAMLTKNLNFLGSEDLSNVKAHADAALAASDEEHPSFKELNKCVKSYGNNY